MLLVRPGDCFDLAPSAEGPRAETAVQLCFRVCMASLSHNDCNKTHNLNGIADSPQRLIVAIQLPYVFWVTQPR